MPTLSGALTRKLNEALDEAFDGPEALDEFLWEMRPRQCWCPGDATRCGC
jgi:hypothetical protein